MEGYCFKCKTKREMVNPTAEWATNGSPGTRGSCPVCAGTMYKTGHTPAHEVLPKTAGVTTKKKAVSRKTGRKTASKTAKTKKVAPKKMADKKETLAKASAAPVRRSGRLVVVESPAKAKTIGRYLGRGYTVKSSVGHVRDLLKSRLSVDIEHNFAPDYRVPNDKRKTVQELKDAASKAAEIYLATDPDREGEAIAWHVLEAAEMDPGRTKRVVFHEITKPAIEEAFKHPRAIDMDRVDAQQARRILDRLVGYKLSPLLWRKIRGNLSAGRVQSVAVRLVVEREREIERFVPVEYWTITAELTQQKSPNGKKPPTFFAKLFKLHGEEPVLSREEEVRPHLAVLQQAEWQVGEVRLGKRPRRPAPPFTTSTLQQEASRRLGYGTTKTMRLAQQLYEGVDVGQEGSVGLITYMRTDSLNVSAEAQEQARVYIQQQFGAAYMPDKPPVYKTKAKGAQEAHEAIRPTAVSYTPAQVKPFLPKDQFQLYKLIWERFVASQMSAAVYDTVSADIWAGEARVKAEKRPYLFRATGSTLSFPGFLALYEETEPEDRPDGGENQVPATLSQQELLRLQKLLPEQHFTQPPPRFGEATLVKALEEHGIGRPSTYASIISTIQDRGYVERSDKKLLPTETGQLVNDLLVEHFPNIVSVDFTAQLEDSLDNIAEGKPWVPVIDAFYHHFVADLAKADAAIPKIELKSEPEWVGRECPLCGKPLVYREGRFGRFVGCSDFPKCRHTEQIIHKLGILCPKDGGEIIERKTKKGRTFYGCANYPACEWTNWKKPLPQPCRVCGGLMVEVGKNTAECTQCGQKQPILVAQAEVV